MKKSVFLIIAFIQIIGCSEKPSADQPEVAATTENLITLTAAQLKYAAIEVGKIEERKIAKVLRVNGRIDVPPQNLVSISVPMGGYLKTTRLLPGMHIQKGEVIAVIEDQQYIQLQQDYLTAKAKIEYLGMEYQRQKDLNETKASSDKIFQLAAADYQTQKILMAALAQKLQLAGINIGTLNEHTISRSINIYAPINGYVSSVKVNIGKYVSPTDVLFELINPTDIHLALKVFEKDIAALSIGLPLTAFTNNDPAVKHPCSIILIGKDIAQDRSTEVHCHFEDYDKSLLPGTYMNADIQVKNNKAWVLPEEALVRFNNNQYIFIKNSPTQFLMKEVKTGSTENGFTEILEGADLVPLEIVKKGAYSLLMSLKNKSAD
jgi:membrane fusion protein, heavy metal efflux system